MKEERCLPSRRKYGDLVPSLDETDITARRDASPPRWTIRSVANALTDLYQFLIKAYLPEWILRIPPGHGWPQITKERFAALQKDDIVIELLKHLPYIRSDWGYDQSQRTWTDSRCIDYAGLRMQRSLVDRQNIEEAEDAGLTNPGSHRVVLAGATSMNGWYLIFNTQNGTIENCSPMYGESDTYDSVADLVEHIKNQFTAMNVIAVEDQDLIYQEQHCKEEMDPMRQLLVKHGWPGSSFDKVSYLKETRMVRLERTEAQEQASNEYYFRFSEDAPYCPKHVAKKLLSFYRFLTSTYLPEDMLRIPPECGWPYISPYGYPDLKKSHRATELLRHLPYIRQDLQDEVPTMISSDCVSIDYSGQLFMQYVDSLRDQLGEGLPHDPLPEHKIPLATTSSKDANAIIFDSMTGKVEWLQAGKTVHNFDDIDGLVEHMMQDFAHFRVLPLNEHIVKDSAALADPSTIKNILQRHNWPNDDFVKHEFIEELTRTTCEWSM